MEPSKPFVRIKTGRYYPDQPHLEVSQLCHWMQDRDESRLFSVDEAIEYLQGLRGGE